MKVATVLGTRPEIIRLSRIIPALDRLCDHVLIHTGQNYDPALSDIFFTDLDVRRPDYHLDGKGNSFGEQIAHIIVATEDVLVKEKPDRLLILGDTNSSLCAIVAKRMGIPVYHMEAGNRCYDDRVPEEVNRRIIDHCSDILLPYTERSRSNLIREGIPNERIYVTGNPILEVIRHYRERVEQSDILNRLNVAKKGYFLVTLHRAENVDIEFRLRKLIEALTALGRQYDLPVICGIHPRTRDKIRRFGLDLDPAVIRLYEPFGFFDFIRLEQDAFCVLSDSGTVQEECCIFHVPNVTLRDVTERPETIECGGNMLSGMEPDDIQRCVRTVLSEKPEWYVPAEYLIDDVSDTVIKVLLAYRYSP